MVDFNAAVKVTLFFEGGFVSDPDDPGGATNFGVSQRAVDALRLGVDVRNLTEAQAIDIYNTHYWLRYGCNQLSELAVATKLFDMLVNFTGSAIRRFQLAINSLHGTQLSLTNALDTNTVRVANGLDTLSFLDALRTQHRGYYEDVIARRPVDAKYQRGWFRRAYWPYMGADRAWPYLPQGDEGWPYLHQETEG